MKYGTRLILGWIIAVGVVGGAALTACAGGPVAGGDGGVTWQTLRFGASKWLNQVTTRIEVNTVDAAGATAAAVVSDQGNPFEASGPMLHKIEIETIIDPAVGATVELKKKFWLDPHQGNVLFGESMRLGQEEYLRRFRFTRQGVYRHRREPESRLQAAQSPHQWADEKASFFSYNLASSDCRHVLEPSVLIYLISQVDFNSNGPAQSYCVFHKRHLFRVWVRKTGVQAIDMAYTEVSGSRSVGRSVTVDAVKLALTAVPLGDAGDEEQGFSFLGFKENIVLYFDAATRLPVMISGRIPTVGQVQLKLNEVRLAD